MKIKDLIPTEEERKKELALADSIITEVKKCGRGAMLVGSIAKETCLRGAKDLDIFILFPKSTPRKTLEKEGLKIGAKVCKAFKVKPKVHYAEHPYTKCTIRGYDVDIVPCYKIGSGEKIISAVDRSPLHTVYVRKHLKRNDDVRLLKKFMKETCVYGAEISTKGFSGYLCELLVIKFGSFQNVLEEVNKWRKGTRIELVKSKAQFREPLVVVDPVDVNRNVAAAVTEENFCRFIMFARHYLKTKQLPKKAKLSAKRGKFFVIEWSIKEDVDEIVWSQLQRFEDKLVRALKMYEFGVIDSMVWTDAKKKAQLLLEMEVWDLPVINDHWGPTAYDKEHSERFLKMYPKSMVRGNRIVTEKPRKYTVAKALLKDYLKGAPSHLKRKPASIKEGAAATKTEVFGKYKQKMWVLK